MSDVETFFRDQGQQAQISIVGAMDDDPETTARALELSEASGTPAGAIVGDVEGFERTHKAALGSAIVQENPHIAEYLNSHPLAPRLSHDDLGALDNASRKMVDLPDIGESPLVKQTRAFKEGFGEFSAKAFLTDPFVKTQTDIDFIQNHPLAASIGMGVGGLVAAPLTFAGKTFGGITAVVNEAFGRDAAAMFEYGIMRGDINAAGTGTHAELSHIAKSINVAGPWLRQGKNPPAGIDPFIDKMKIEQAKGDKDALSDALSESVKSATRERSADFYSNFARSHVGDQQIGISADAIRELYGDKAPASGDNLLGWVPDIGNKLAAAEATGGDVRVPLADWLAKADPDVAKQLEDHIRARPDGITVEEGKALEPKENTEHPLPVEGELPEGVEPPKRIESSVVEEPLPLLRGSAGLEPMFSIGDRKVKLERMGQAKTAEEALSRPMGDAVEFHDFNLLDHEGKPVGSVNLSEQKGGKQLYIEMIQAGADKRMYDPNFLGPALIRDLLRQLRAEFPNAETITGHRVSGAREKAESYMKPSASPVVKFDQSPASAESFRKLLSEHWRDEGQGVETQYKPIDLWTSKEKELGQAIREELHKLAPGVETKVANAIERPTSTMRTSGVHMIGGLDTGFLPKIIVSLEASDPLGVARHEAIHHLKNMGLFTPEDWATLTRAARSEDWVSKFNIDQRYPDLANATKLEEAVADGYKAWKAGQIKDPGVFQKIADFFEQLRLRFKEILGKDFTWEELFQKVDQGEVGRREPNSARGEAMFNIEGDIPDIGGKEAERLRERIQSLGGELSVAKSQGFDIKAPEFEARATELSEAQASLRSITSGTFGMSVPQFTRYMALMKKRQAEDLAYAKQRAEDQQRKSQTKEWKANRVEMRDEVREEVETQPDIAADQMFAEEKLKFHPDSLTAEQKEMLPKEYIQKKDGLSPDDMAGFFGFASGDGLVSRIAAITAERQAAGMKVREWINHLIDSETDRRMMEKYGDLDRRILDEAKDQAISETQLNLLHEEVLHLGLQAGSEFPISKAQLREWNREVFDRTPIDSISTDDYLRAAGKAGKAAEMALLKEDFADAFREKQRQNNAMIMASYAKAYEKARASFDRTAKTFQKREVPSVPAEWTNWIHDILQRTGNKVNRSIQDIQENISRQGEKTLTDFVDAKEAETFGEREIPIPDFLLDPNFRTEMGKLTADQFYDVKQAIDTLVKQGRDEKKIYAQGEAADRNEVLREMRDKVGTFPKEKLPDEKNWLDKKLDTGTHYIAGVTTVPTLMRRWERLDPRGIFSRYITYPLRQADNTQNVLQREVSKALREVGKVEDGSKLVDAPFPNPLTRTEARPEGERWAGFTRNHVLGMLAHAGNKSNWRVLAKGFSTEPAALMDWLVKNTTKEDWAQAQKRGDMIFKPLIGKADTVYEHITGATVEKIPLEPISNAYGEFEGWYHPLVADPLMKEVWTKNEDTGIWSRNSVGKRDSVLDKYGKSYATTANGYTRKRSGAVYPLDLDISTMNGTINQMIRDISHRQAIIEVEKVLNDRSFQAEVIKHYGHEYAELLPDYLKDMAGQASLPSKSWQRAGRVMETFRQNVISTYIGFNPYTAMKHGPTALVWSMREVGPKAFLPEFGKQLAERLVGDPIRSALDLVGAEGYANAVKGLYARSPELGLSMSEFAMKHSEELQRRERHWQDTISGETMVLKGESTFREKIIEKGSWLVAQSDMLSAKPTWIAEFNKRQAEGLSFGESVILADDSVVRAHGSTGKSNQPAFVRGGGATHGFLVSVYGFMGNRLQRMIETVQLANDTYKLGREGEIKEAAKNLPKLLTDLMTYSFWPIIVEEAVASMNTEDHRSKGMQIASGLTMGMASSLLYIRDIIHGLASDHDPGVGLLSSAAHDLANAVRGVMRGKEAFNRQHAGKTVGDILTVLGEAKGISPKPIGNAMRFGIDLVNKQQRPKTGVEYFRGLTRGEAKRKQHK